jgi:hypothetical protein
LLYSQSKTPSQLLPSFEIRQTKQKYYKSVPTPVPVYKSTQMLDHFQKAPSIQNPVIRSDQQLAHLVRNFQQLPSIFGGDHPT